MNLNTVSKEKEFICFCRNKENNELIFENCNWSVETVPLFTKEIRNETDFLLKGTITILVTVCCLYLKNHIIFTHITLSINVL